MATDLKFGIQTNGIKHAHADPTPDIDTRFRMVQEAGVFDYVDKTPAPDEIDESLAASAKYGLPIRASGWFYTLGRDEALLKSNLQLAKEFGSLDRNTQVMMHHADGHLISNEEVVDFYMQAVEWGEAVGVTPCFEVHVNMWSEHFGCVSEVARAVEVVNFHMTLDHSHVIFKIDNPAEQEVLGMRAAVEAGEVVLDPFQPGNVTDGWIETGWVRHCHARAAIPNNPLNTAATGPDGKPGRGIQYPFVEPGPGQYHAEWDADALEPWKQVIRSLLRHHARDETGQLGQISTEFIPNLDYGEGCGYSLFEQGIACTRWMRETWDDVRAE